MSTFYKEKNNETTFELFTKSAIYANSTIDSRYLNLDNFLAEKILYGRVNRVFMPIVVSQRYNGLKTIPGNSQVENDSKALNFVVDAFMDLQQNFAKSSLTNKIDNSDQYLSNLKVYKAYSNPYELYQNYIRKYQQILKSDPVMDTANLSDFNKMVTKIQEISHNAGTRNPLTFTAFVKSRKAPINISGLAIEIADLDPVNDNEKINNFVNSRNWNYYLNACKAYGFMVDSNVPWRLVADIGSSVMLSYAKRYGFDSVESILFNYYDTANYQYYNNFPEQMLGFYNNLKPKSIVKVEDCNGSVRRTRVYPKNYNIDNLKRQYGENNFIALYCNLRFNEEERSYSDLEKNKLLKKTFNLSKTISVSYALDEFEREINKTFDYQGSLGYYVEKAKVLREEEVFGEGTRSSNQTARY
jgi:hypothetical protein